MNFTATLWIVAALMHPANGTSTKASVQIGQDGPNLDACGGVAWVNMKDAGTKAQAVVKSSPSRDAKTVDTLDQKEQVFMCDYAGADNEWTGIVYGGGKDVDCGVGSPVTMQQDYTGPCRSGWVLSENIELIAG